MSGRLQGFPVHEKRNGVLVLGNTVVRLRRGGAFGCGCDDASGDTTIFHHPSMNVDVVRGEVVGDIAISASPCLEGLELALGLAHPRIEEVEFSKSSSAAL